MDVWVPAPNTAVQLKVEDSVDAFQFAEVNQVAPNVGWNTLTFDFSTVSINTSDSFEKMVLIFNVGQTRNNETYYFDNIQLLP